MEEIEKDMIPKLMGETWRKSPTETSKHKATYGLFQCQYCGKEFETNIQSVKCGDTKSCGCINLRITHGLTKHPIYGTWAAMVKRCTNYKSWDYKYYGGRGVTVCDEWLDVRNFVAWYDLTHPKVKGLTLDRIDNQMGYSPSNCHWVDMKTQANNKRIGKNNTSGYVGVYSGVIKDGWYAKVGSNNKLINIGSFKTKEEAAQARDTYIIENGLPNKLSGLIID